MNGHSGVAAAPRRKLAMLEGNNVLVGLWWMMPWQHTGELAAVTTAFLWTLSALAWTSAGRRVGALAVSLLRLLIACGLMMVYSRVFRGWWLPTDATPYTWLMLGVSGVIGFFVSDLCMLKAFLLIGPRLSLLIGSLTPPIAAILSSAFIDDPLTWRSWCAMVVTLAGIVWVVLEQPDEETHPYPQKHRGLGIALALLSATTMAISYVFSKEGLHDYHPEGATLIRLLTSLPGYILLIVVGRRWSSMFAAVCDGRAMTMLTFGAFVGPFAGVVFSMIALQNAPTGVVATIVATMPVLILPFSIFLYHEKVSLRAAGGAAVAVAGIALLML